MAKSIKRKCPPIPNSNGAWFEYNGMVLHEYYFGNLKKGGLSTRFKILVY
jgi:hypothetical protein